MPFRSRPRSPTAKFTKLDTAAAEKMPGVRAIFHRENIGKIFRSTMGTGFEGICDRATAAVRRRCHSLLRPIRRARRGGHFRDRQGRGRCGSRYLRQRETERRTRPQSGRRVRHTVETTFGPEARAKRARRCRGAFASAPVKLDQTYVTPAETHNPIELQGTTAMWDGSNLTDL